MRRFFLDTDLSNKEEIQLPAEEAKHISKVLRMKEGDFLEIINGKGEIFTGKIIECTPKKISVQKTAYSAEQLQPPLLHIAIAPPKNIDRLEWFLEKSTELGIHEITPIICKNSERKSLKIDRLEKILIAAVKQSKRLFLPKIHPPISFDEFIQNFPSGFIAHCFEEEERNTTIYKELKANEEDFLRKNPPILIGPEGDFTLEEIKKALQNGYKSVTLGKNRLRTETAGIYACTIVKLYFEEKE